MLSDARKFVGTLAVAALLAGGMMSVAHAEKASVENAAGGEAVKAMAENTAAKIAGNRCNPRK